MSKYTTEVRYICENYAKQSNSEIDLYDIPEVCGLASVKIFDVDQACSFHMGAVSDEMRRHFRTILPQVLMRNYTREIGSETVGLWKLRIQSRLNDILPYYVEMFETLELQYDPFIDTDYESVREDRSTRSDSFEFTDNETVNDTTNTVTEGHDVGHNLGNSIDTVEDSDRYSDTPQGTVKYLEISDNMFLSNARLRDNKNENEHEDTNEFDSERTHNEEREKNTEKSGSNVRNIENGGNDKTRVKGKMGTASYASMLIEYRKSLMNINEKFFNEFNDMFMLIY